MTSHLQAHLPFILFATLTAAALSQPQKQTASGLSANTVIAQAKTAALLIQNDFQRGDILDRVGAAEAKSGNMDLAIGTANRAYPHNMATLTQIGKTLAAKNTPVPLQSIRAKLKSGSSSTVLAFLARDQAAKGEVTTALKTAENIDDESVRAEARHWIAEQQASRGDWDGVRKTLALVTTARSGPKNASDDDAAMLIVNGHLSRSHTQAAHEAVASLKSPQSRSFALLSGADLLLKRSDKTAAKQWLDEAFQNVSPGPASDFMRYFAIPMRIALGERDQVMQSTANLNQDLRLKGYTAIAISCAEQKDKPCVFTALEKIRATPKSDPNLDQFIINLNILGVTAALLDAGEIDMALDLLKPLEDNASDPTDLTIKADAQLQRVFALAKKSDFEAARYLALTMRRNTVSDVQRGTAVRTVAYLETKAVGAITPNAWATALADPEDRAYALTGCAEFLLGIDDVKLPYNAIQIH